MTRFDATNAISQAMAAFDHWSVGNTAVLLGYMAFLCGLLLLSVALEGHRKRQLLVQAVRERLLRSVTTVAVYRIDVQMNDGTTMRFSTTMPLAAGDFVEADLNGQLQPANLLGNQRVIGVVVACTVQLPPPGNGTVYK